MTREIDTEEAGKVSPDRGSCSRGPAAGAVAVVAAALAAAAALLAGGPSPVSAPAAPATPEVPGAPEPTSASAAAPPGADTVPELGDVVRYRVAVRRGGGSSREAVWRVVQGPEVASVFLPAADGRDLAAAWGVTGPAVDGRPWLVKGARRALVPLWEDGPGYRPGVAADRGRSRVVLRDLDYRFWRGASDRRVAGRRAQHWVLETDVRVVFQPRGIGRRLGSDSADVHLRTDFWFLRDVPFSWAPLTPTGAKPLSVGVEPAARTLRADLEPLFRRLGLPVRTETTERWEPYGTPDLAMPSDSRRGLRVDSLRPASPPAADAEVLRYGRVTAGQGQPAPPSSRSSSSP